MLEQVGSILIKTRIFSQKKKKACMHYPRILLHYLRNSRAQLSTPCWLELSAWVLLCGRVVGHGCSPAGDRWGRESSPESVGAEVVVTVEADP